MWCSTSSSVSSKSSRRLRIRSPSSSTSSWLSPPAGSSRSSRRGPAASARASSTRFRVPYESSRRRAGGRAARGRRSRAARGRSRPRRACAADEHVLEHGHRAEQLDVLERARDPAPDDPVRRRAQQALAVEDDLALVRLVQPRDQVEERRLAGAVRADQADDLALADVERDVVDRDDPAEPPRHVLDREQGHAETLRRAARSGLEGCCLGDGRLAGEALADVDGRLAVDELLALEQRHALGRAEGDDRVRVERLERRARDLARRAGRRSRSPAASRGRGRARSAPRRTRSGRGRGSRRTGAGRRPRAARARRRRRSAPGAAARRRASSCPTGAGWSYELLPPRDELLALGRREEEAAVLVVGEQLDREQREPPRLLEPAQLAGRDVQLVEAVRDVGVVVEEARPARASARGGCGRGARSTRHRPEQELAERARLVDPVRRARAAARPRPAPPARGRSTRRSPCRRAPAAAARRATAEQPRPRLRVERAAQDEAAVLERLEQLLGRALARRPGVGQPLDAVGVGVLRRRRSRRPAARRSRSRYSTVSSTTSR